MLFIYFCLISLASIFSTVLNRSDRSGSTCLVPDFMVKVFTSVTKINDVGSGVFVDSLYRLRFIIFIEHFHCERDFVLFLHLLK